MRRLLLALAMFAAAHALWAAESRVPTAQRRPVEQTFLTYPEWFLVHSPAEYARYVGKEPAHGFPFLGHIGQIWSSYASVTREQWRAGYPANAGYHVMIGVIATSTTVEYSLRSLYENTLGRISWALSSRQLTPEDQYGARVAQDYVDFIRKQPWYLYDFAARLKGLWSGTPAWGPDMLRKWERRYALSTEYLIKAAYGKLIEVATRSAYDPAALTTLAVADTAPPIVAMAPGVRIVETYDDGRALLELPRYYEFRLAATKLAWHHVALQDIAGNSSVILVTVIAQSEGQAVPQGARLLFQQPLITEPGRHRYAVVLPVAALSPFLANAARTGVEVEHVYDY